MSTKLVIYNTLSYYTAYGLLFFSCKRLHFEQGMVTATTNGYDLPTSPVPPPYDTLILIQDNTLSITTNA
ncbi:MAG: hypothetical protein HXO50_06130 [Prevotella sp.]|nr:hypothetical protein [Prevotella sp.]